MKAEDLKITIDSVEFKKRIKTDTYGTIFDCLDIHCVDCVFYINGMCNGTFSRVTAISKTFLRSRRKIITRAYIKQILIEHKCIKQSI